MTKCWKYDLLLYFTRNPKPNGRRNIKKKLEVLKAAKQDERGKRTLNATLRENR